MMTTEQFYALLARADAGYGVLFASVFLMVVWGRVSFPYFRMFVPAKNPMDLRVPKRVEWLVGVLAVGVRLPGMFQSFWYDETWSASIAQLPAERLPEVILADVHPPLSYLVFWLNDKLFPEFEVFTRIPSLVFGLASLYLIYRLTKRMFNRNTALLTTMIVAILPAHIYYSNEARGYALLLCLVLIGMIAIQEDRKRWFMVAGLLPLVHAHGYIYLFVLAAVALIHHPNWKWFRILATSGVAGAAWFPFMLQQSVDVANGFWLQPLTIPGTLWYILDMTVGSRIEPAAVMLVYIPIMAITIISLWFNRRWLIHRRGWLWLSIAVVVPLITAGISFTWKPIYLLRALLPSALLFVPLWSHTMLNWKHETTNITRLGTITALLIALCFSFTTDAQRTDNESFFDLCQGSNATFVMSNHVGVVSLIYAPSPVMLWSEANDGVQYLTDSGKDGFGFHQGYIDELRGDICVPVIHVPMTSTHEIDYLNTILSKYEYRRVVYQDTHINNMTVYRVMVR